MTREFWRLGIGVPLACALLACGEQSGQSGDPAPSASVAARFDLTRLRSHEEQLRQGLELSKLSGADVASGPDPYRLIVLQSGGLAGLLRGRDQLVLFDAAGKEVGRFATPHAPTAMAEGEGELRVVSELRRELWSYDLSKRTGGDTKREAVRKYRLKSPVALRGLVRAGAHWYATDELSGSVVRLDAGGEDIALVKVADCRGALDVRATQNWLGVNCLLEHRIKLFRLPMNRALTSDVTPQTLENQGPFWTFELWESHQALNVVASGVEDAPLDRTIGSFGNIDSYMYSFRVDQRATARTSAVNVSASGAVLPKAIWLGPEEAGARSVAFAGFATSGVFEMSWNAAGLSEAHLAVPSLPPGTSDLERVGGGFLAANSLLDAWVGSGADGALYYREESGRGDSRSASVRLGEALFFTNLMAPHNRSAGKLSRFTCETCHFEGYGDGRIHATGRGEITATTKPLLGLVGNRPYFTRGLDRDLAQMVNNEFRVAGANSGASPIFGVHTEDWSWLAKLGVEEPELDPEQLREALLDFLVHFNHRPNPNLAERARGDGLTTPETQGAALFAEHCATCHGARLDASDPKTEVPTAKWPSALLEQQPIVWASVGYKSTGVEPRVHPEGARPSSLRRLYKKAPYFTNGQAPDLSTLLAQCGYGAGRFLHLGVPQDGKRFSAEERLALEQFLRLL
ncbi:MAG: hypothetical protein KC492_03235 [Myxococcales bacterium]|nr:hypothetical protein [Myxococcales bacterium]